MYRSIVISSGHGLNIRGAHGVIDEVDEARGLVERLASDLQERGVEVTTFHDDQSYTQDENLRRIVDFHNCQNRELDISVHFNAYEQVSKPMGTEVLFVNELNGALAGSMASIIALAGGFINRGPKQRSDLYFLNNTDMPAILLEVCFVDSTADCQLYENFFGDISIAIADFLSGLDGCEEPEPPPPCTTSLIGKCSWFGGPDDDGVSPDEGLAFIYNVMDAPQLFLPYQPEGTTGLARRLNPYVHYIACRWNYDEVSKEKLLTTSALVRSMRTGKTLVAMPADWGPHGDTDRMADLSPALFEALGLQTDDLVEVTFPYKEI